MDVRRHDLGAASRRPTASVRPIGRGSAGRFEEEMRPTLGRFLLQIERHVQFTCQVLVTRPHSQAIF